MSSPTETKPTPAAAEPAQANGAPVEESLASLKIEDGDAKGQAAADGVAPASEAARSTAAPAPTSAQQAAAAANSTSLYVGELDFSVTEAMLYEIFSMVGPVSSIRVCRDAVTRRSLGYAYVNYLNANDAERALDQLNYSLIKNKACRIMVSQRDPALRKTGAGNIFLKNLDETIDNKALHDTFAAFGTILSCKVALDENGVSRGFGFVHFDTGEAADAAIAGVNGMLLNDKVVFVGHHVPKRERQAKIDEVKSHFTNLYVKNLPTEVEEKEFRELFEKFGTVTSAVVTTDAEGKSKGFGFVNLNRMKVPEKQLMSFTKRITKVNNSMSPERKRRASVRRNCARVTSRPNMRRISNIKVSIFMSRISMMILTMRSSMPNSLLLAPSPLAKLWLTTKAHPKASALSASLLPMKLPRLSLSSTAR